MVKHKLLLLTPVPGNSVTLPRICLNIFSCLTLMSFQKIESLHCGTISPPYTPSPPLPQPPSPHHQNHHNHHNHHNHRNYHNHHNHYPTTSSVQFALDWCWFDLAATMAFRVVRLRREARRNAKLDEIFQVSKFKSLNVVYVLQSSLFSPAFPGTISKLYH